jgi:hypothetical protein
VTLSCNARSGVCAATGPNDPLGVNFRGRPPGLYYLIVEANAPASAGQAEVQFVLEGCTPSRDLGPLGVGQAVAASLDTTAGTAVFEAGCAAQSGGEQVIAFQVTQTSAIDVAWMQTGDHVIALMREDGGDCDETPVACHDPAGVASGFVTFPRVVPGRYLLMVDATAPGDEGLVDLQITAR